MELHNLKPAKGSVKNRKRIARGQGSGRGGTSTKGHKGQKSRAGYSAKKGFEGGGITLWKRTPKRGFKNINRVSYTALNLARIQEIADKYKLTTISPETLAENGIIRKNNKFKVLAFGEVSSKIDVTAHAFSAKAKEAIESKGGTAKLA